MNSEENNLLMDANATVADALEAEAALPPEELVEDPTPTVTDAMPEFEEIPEIEEIPEGVGEAADVEEAVTDEPQITTEVEDPLGSFEDFDTEVEEEVDGTVPPEDEPVEVNMSKETIEEEIIETRTPDLKEEPSIAEEPAGMEPMTEEPISEEAVEEPACEESVEEEPVDEEPAGEDLTDEEPVEEEPVEDTPTSRNIEEAILSLDADIEAVSFPEEEADAEDSMEESNSEDETVEDEEDDPYEDTEEEIEEETEESPEEEPAPTEEELAQKAKDDYLDEIDRGYQERRARRMKKIRRMRIIRFFRRLIFTILLILILAFSSAIVYLKYEAELPFYFVGTFGTVLHKLDPIADRIPLPFGPDAKKAEEEKAQAETEAFIAPDAETVASDETAADQGAASAAAQKAEPATETAGFFSGYKVTTEGAEEIPDSNEEIVSKYVALINLDKGTIVAERRSEQQIVPASMSKVLTILVAAEHINADQLNAEVAMDQQTADYVLENNCSTSDLQVGEPVTVRDLFYGTILPSGGDAALTLAKYVAGSQDAFVEMMNAKLVELGLDATSHCTNCIGLYDENHYSTASDIAMIMKAAIENETCREVLSAQRYTTSSTASFPEGVELSNWFLRRIADYPETNGEVRAAKTGFVNESGNCAVSYCISNDGTHYACVTAGSASSWQCIYDQISIYHMYVK